MGSLGGPGGPNGPGGARGPGGPVGPGGQSGQDHLAQMLCIQKIYDFCGLNHQIIKKS